MCAWGSFLYVCNPSPLSPNCVVLTLSLSVCLTASALQGEIKISVSIEDEANKELPSAVQLFRPIRQYVYGVLFSLAEAKKKAERLAVRRNRLPECE